MKSLLLPLTLLAFPAFCNAEREKLVVVEPITKERLLDLHRKSDRNDPMRKFEPATGKDPFADREMGGLLRNSDVISFNGRTTLVPKNALVTIPKKFSSRINNHKAGFKVVGWLDFFSVNQAWISTVEVTFPQARGEVPVDPEILKHLGKTGNMVVAVLKAGPISVMPPEPKADAEVLAASKTTSP